MFLSNFFLVIPGMIIYSYQELKLTIVVAKEVVKPDYFYEINLSIYFTMHSMIINCYHELNLSI